MDGYVWWYLDALSDDGQHALTVIAFIGSVFSPYYALSRHRGRGDPFNHCAINVALYGPKSKRWALTERTREDLSRDSQTLRIGPSGVSWDGQQFEFMIDECTVPFPARLKGRIRVVPNILTDKITTLDKDGRHSWVPLAPSARVSIDFDSPSLRWSGEGYVDCNFGDEPLERAFTHWNWSRAHNANGTTVLYEGEWRTGETFSVARRIDPSGVAQDFAPPPVAKLPMTRWLVGRETRCDRGCQAVVLKTFEDTPFYSRSLIETTILGERVRAIHESLSLDRLANPIVRAMLPFRMPRRRFNRWLSPAD